MTIKAETLKDDAELNAIVEFLKNNLSDKHTIVPESLAKMVNYRAGIMLVKREEGEIKAVQVWITMPDPLQKSKRLCKLIGECGDTADFKVATDTAFSMFENGWELL
jgi:hypothetical protein